MKHAVFVVVVLALLLAATELLGRDAVATDVIPVRVTTGHYQLDTGQMVTWWIDEPRGLLCEALSNGSLLSDSMSCLPLTASSYNWPALPEVKP
jgi:hypothetical protein